MAIPDPGCEKKRPLPALATVMPLWDQLGGAGGDLPKSHAWKSERSCPQDFSFSALISQNNLTTLKVLFTKEKGFLSFTGLGHKVT